MRCPGVHTMCILALGLVIGGCGVFFEPMEEAAPQIGTGPTEVSSVSQGVAAGAPGSTADDAVADVQPARTAESGADATSGAEAAPSDAADAGPLAADMLSLAEEAAAVDLALAAAEAHELLAAAVDRDGLVAHAAGGPRVTDLEALAALGGEPSYRVIYTQRRWGKASTTRRAEVLLYRYDTAQAMLLEVDLETGDTVEIDFGELGAVPLAPGEIAEADAIARADERVLQALDEAGLPADAPATATMTVGLEPDSRCATHRCVRLLFASLREPVARVWAVVDAADLQVVEIGPPWFEEEQG